MGINKSRAKGKEKASKAQKPTAKRRSRKPAKPVDLVEVRKKLAEVVGPAAPEIIQAIVDEAKKGQLAHAKYALESTGVYPAADGDSTKPEDDSLAQRLWKRLGLPEEPVICDDEAEAELSGPIEDQVQTDLRGAMEQSVGKEKRTTVALVEAVNNDTVE